MMAPGATATAGTANVIVAVLSAMLIGPGVAVSVRALVANCAGVRVTAPIAPRPTPSAVIVMTAGVKVIVTATGVTPSGIAAVDVLAGVSVVVTRPGVVTTGVALVVSVADVNVTAPTPPTLIAVATIVAVAGASAMFTGCGTGVTATAVIVRATGVSETVIGCGTGATATAVIVYATGVNVTVTGCGVAVTATAVIARATGVSVTAPGCGVAVTAGAVVVITAGVSVTDDVVDTDRTAPTHVFHASDVDHDQFHDAGVVSVLVAVAPALACPVTVRVGFHRSVVKAGTAAISMPESRAKIDNTSVFAVVVLNDVPVVAVPVPLDDVDPPSAPVSASAIDTAPALPRTAVPTVTVTLPPATSVAVAVLR